MGKEVYQTIFRRSRECFQDTGSTVRITSTLLQCCVANLHTYTTDSEINFKKIIVASGIEQLLDALRLNQRDARLQQFCLWVLWSPAQQEGLRARITAGGGAGVVITAMNTHPFNTALQEQAIWCRCLKPPQSNSN